MVVFGGFTTDGEPSNDLFKFYFNENRWERIYIQNGADQPSPRIGHSAIIYQDSMYIFGGKDTEDRFDDMWRFDLQSNTWSQVECGNNPVARSGHTAQVWG